MTQCKHCGHDLGGHDLGLGQSYCIKVLLDKVDEWKPSWRARKGEKLETAVSVKDGLIEATPAPANLPGVKSNFTPGASIFGWCGYVEQVNKFDIDKFELEKLETAPRSLRQGSAKEPAREDNVDLTKVIRWMEYQRFYAIRGMEKETTEIEAAIRILKEYQAKNGTGTK